jgi:hypothetical protein
VSTRHESGNGGGEEKAVELHGESLRCGALGPRGVSG